LRTIVSDPLLAKGSQPYFERMGTLAKKTHAFMRYETICYNWLRSGWTDRGTVAWSILSYTGTNVDYLVFPCHPEFDPVGNDQSLTPQFDCFSCNVAMLVQGVYLEVA
jgi:hypothetical protein